ncbi:hypothetical protein BVRB_9g224990 [Beta vulgaris subsp. vulgaris]|uniref:Uncharacterized protein n=1 Tax=Beta vulgaris subsp. vulgaris TaxID=3555 RepID=A0A0J8E013_BETVV|nr:hypothetical protein BVRB_9g224990 [Beta vulgaris subsp. vulgaris]
MLKRSSESTNFGIANRCKEKVWPGIIPSESISYTAFILNLGRSSVISYNCSTWMAWANNWLNRQLI